MKFYGYRLLLFVFIQLRYCIDIQTVDITMTATHIIDQLRSRIRLLRYASRYPTAEACLRTGTHPVTLGPEQMSRFFAFVANNERRHSR